MMPEGRDRGGTRVSRALPQLDYAPTGWMQTMTVTTGWIPDHGAIKSLSAIAPLRGIERHKEAKRNLEREKEEKR